MKRSLLVIMAAVVALAAVMIPLSLRQSSWNQGYDSALTGSFLQNQEKTSSTLSESSAVDGIESQVEEEQSSELYGTQPTSNVIPSIPHASPSSAGQKGSVTVSSKAAVSIVSSRAPASSAPAGSSSSLSNPNVQPSRPASSKPPVSSSRPGSTNLSYTAQVVELVNEERQKAGLDPLTVSPKAASAAQVSAKELEISFAHTRPNGSSFFTALTEQGVKYRGAGENIAWGQKTPVQVMQGWMNSSGHRANILNADFTGIGVGYYKNGAGTNYWVQLFIRE